MTADRIPMTREGYDKLKAELDRLRNVEMIAVTTQMAADPALSSQNSGFRGLAARMVESIGETYKVASQPQEPAVPSPGKRSLDPAGPGRAATRAIPFLVGIGAFMRRGEPRSGSGPGRPEGHSGRAGAATPGSWSGSAHSCAAVNQEAGQGPAGGMVTPGG